MIKNKVFNVGINDEENMSRTKSYKVWIAMLRRCYDKKYHEMYPTYKDCTVCNEWLYFSNFKKWFDKNYRWDLENAGIKLELDKDLLSDKTNKLYSPTTCIFLPYDVNTFIRKRDANNTSGYIGISWDKSTNNYKIRIQDFETKKNINLGRCEDINVAYKKYKIAFNEQIIKVKNYLLKLNYDFSLIQELEDKFNKEI